MNPARMSARGLEYTRFEAGRLAHCTLRFNKRAHHKSGVGYANICRAPNCEVQGVLYELAESTHIAMMDTFEGTPVRYSRERFEIVTGKGCFWAWVYIANPAFIDDSLGVEENYLNHLLSAGDLLSADYRERLQSLVPVIESGDTASAEQGLRFNV